jgi:hypothetical protein
VLSRYLRGGPVLRRRWRRSLPWLGDHLHQLIEQPLLETT